MNLPPIHEMWLESKAAKIKQSPQNNLRASSLGHPCERKHFYAIKAWREKALHDPILQSIFDEGYLHEQDVTIQLMQMGFIIIEQQRAFQMDKPLITGHIDGIIRYDGQDFPFDVKSIASWDFDKINAAEDLMYSKKEHQRGYIAQLQLYLLMLGRAEVGCFILKNKQTGEIKPIWCTIDYDYCEKLLKRAERVYASIEKNEPPARVEDVDVCQKCDFRHICLPDLKMSGINLIDDIELGGTLERLDQLKPFRKEYEELDAQVNKVKDSVGAGEFVCGDFLIQVKEYKKKVKVALTWSEEESSYLVKKVLRLVDKKENAA